MVVGDAAEPSLDDELEEELDVDEPDEAELEWDGVVAAVAVVAE